MRALSRQDNRRDHLDSGAGLHVANQPRAQRFELHVPVLYRRTGDETWIPGQTRDISRSGVLFDVDIALDTENTIELLLLMPERAPSAPAANIRCRGRIVRRLVEAAPPTGLAVKFSDYHFVPVENSE